MKAFKGKSFVAPIEKDRKEMGKFQEKVDQKYVSSKGKISNGYKNSSSSMGSLPSKNSINRKKNKKWTYGELFLISFIVLMISFFIFLLISIVFFPSEDENKKNNDLNINDNIFPQDKKM